MYNLKDLLLPLFCKCVKKGKELRLKLYREEQDMLIYVETQKLKRTVESDSVFIDPDDDGTNWGVRLVSESVIQ